jgi:hypothetical protein
VAIALGLHPNVGLPFGYYGELNRVMSRLRRIPNVEVLWVGVNYDVTVEEITIDMRIDGEYSARLFLSDRWSSRWELFDSADSLTWNGQYLRLGSEGLLTRSLGRQISGGEDVLKNYGDIVRLLEQTRPDAPGASDVPASGMGRTLSITTSHRR